MAVVIETELGMLKGRLWRNHNNKQYYAFKGIPYAKPPVRNLRFTIPQPPEPWEGIRDCTKGSKTCAQIDDMTGLVVGEEDCLYLNVYTPKLPDNNSTSLPVMVFIHGGGFVFGCGTDSTVHGPDYLIDKDVILVTPNYRVGILGFLALDIKEAPGNMGLRDQVMALKWVQKNIANFGGDPSNVTIFGISAGGASVEYLLLSPTAKGLFHKAIAQSGSSLLHWAQHDSDKIKNLARRIAAFNRQYFSRDIELLKYLKKMSLRHLLRLSMFVLVPEIFKGCLNFGWVPVVEKPTDWEPFISKSTYNMLAKGEFTKVPYMTGFCTREGLLSVSHSSEILEELTKTKKFVNYFPFKLDNVEKVDIEPKLKSIYLEGEHISKDADAYAIDFFSDSDFLGGVYTAAMLIAKHNSAPVYFYEFSYDGALNYLKRNFFIERVGASHADEGGYILKCKSLNDPLSETDKSFQNFMLDLWTNFAKYGDPNSETNGFTTRKWKPIGERAPACYVIDTEPYMKYEVYSARTKLYKEMYERKYGENL